MSSSFGKSECSRRALGWCCPALAPLRKCALASRTHGSPSCGGLCVSSVLCTCDSSMRPISWLKSKTAFIRSPYFINLAAEPMEQIHSELVCVATELEAVRGQVQTECNALRESLCTDHYSHVKFRFTARPAIEPQRSWKALPTAIRWKPS